MENAQRIMLLLPLLRRKLNSVISNGNCKLRIFFLLKILIVVFLVFLVSLKKIWGKWIYDCKACCIIKTHRDNGGSVADFLRGFFFSRRLAMLRRREKNPPLTKSATERPIVPVCKIETSYCFVT